MSTIGLDSERIRRDYVHMDDIDATVKFLKNREAKRRQVLDARYESAVHDCAMIIDYIVANHHPACIWQWGSLLDRRKFTEVSDIDLAIEGLTAPGQIFDILRYAESVTDFPVDIIELDKIELEFIEIIRMRGRIIYEAV